ncbi:hypothetical protein QW180_27495 [Vibrio sinaloensis]|nr:hypothetical protein [Vibrio sinaloensis]
MALGLTASVGLVGCGGGSGSDSSTSDNTGSSTSYSVTAIDGYLKGAQVWLDLNRNFQLDANEPTATSGDGGKASLNVDGIDNPEQYPVVVRAIKGKNGGRRHWQCGRNRLCHVCSGWPARCHPSFNSCSRAT